MSILSWLSGGTTSLRPRLACEIMPSGVVAARDEGTPGAAPAIAFAAIPPQAVTAGLKTPNLPDAAAVTAALRKALSDVGAREKTLTLVIPDPAVRVLLLDFDSLPSRPQEALPLIRFRVRKLVPFEVDDAPITYQVMQQTSTQVRAVVVVTPREVLAEYEALVRDAGYEPGVVLSSTVASVAAVSGDEAALVVNRNAQSVTTAITNKNELLLHRTLELPLESEAQSEELRQSVSVALAYFEDTLNTPAAALLAAGPGGAGELGRLLADESTPVRELVPAPSTGLVSAIPSGTFAGVTGALAS